MKSFLGIYCSYCRVYFRIYQDRLGRRYHGRCPRCGRYVQALIDRFHGIKRRFFIGR